MRRLTQYLVFFGIFLSVLGAVHYHLWVRLIRDPAWPEPWTTALSVALSVLFVALPATMIASRSLPKSVARALTLPSYVWLGTMFLLWVCVLGTELARLGGWIAGFATGEYQASRHAAELAAAQLGVSRALSLTAVSIALCGTLWALVQGNRFLVRRVKVPLHRLPPSLDGLTLVQLSDVHVGPSLGVKFVQQVVATVNRLQPDLVVITGDLVDGPVATLGGAVSELSGLRSRFGTFFVTGNHEYYSGAEAWCEHLRSIGVRVLRNEHVSIGEGANSLDLAGIDDYQGRQFGNGHGADLPKALAGRDSKRELVLLAHQPRAVFEAQQHGVGLVLSGHTHGGQLWPFSWLVKLQQPVVSGLRKIGATWIYVSNGTGYWGPPMRLGAPAEVTQIVLRSADATSRAGG